MSELVTYSDQTPDNIRTGDHIVDHYGRDYIAETDATYVRETLAYDVRVNGRWVSYDATDRVTISYDASLYEADIYA